MNMVCSSTYHHCLLSDTEQVTLKKNIIEK